MQTTFAVAYAVTKTGSEWDDVKTDRVQPVFFYPDPENGKEDAQAPDHMRIMFVPN